MAANLLRRILSLISSIDLTSSVTGLYTNIGFFIPNAAANGWKSPSPTKRKPSTSASMESAELQLQPRTCPGYANLLSPTPILHSIPILSRIFPISGRRPKYCTVANNPTFFGNDFTTSENPSPKTTSDLVSTYMMSESEPIDGIGE